jgi:hypothetical protein
MGDVASSLFALGYHEKIEEDSSDVPLFVAELRRSCFARVFAADKSLAVFLGRPPRVTKEFCYFQVPLMMASAWNDADTTIKKDNNSPLAYRVMSGREPNEEHALNYTSDTVCAAVFALLKEEVLQLFRKRHAFCETDVIKLV